MKTSWHLLCGCGTLVLAAAANSSLAQVQLLLESDLPVASNLSFRQYATLGDFLVRNTPEFVTTTAFTMPANANLAGFTSSGDEYGLIIEFPTATGTSFSYRHYASLGDLLVRNSPSFVTPLVLTLPANAHLVGFGKAGDGYGLVVEIATATGASLSYRQYESLADLLVRDSPSFITSTPLTLFPNQHFAGFDKDGDDYGVILQSGVNLSYRDYASLGDLLVRNSPSFVTSAALVLPANVSLRGFNVVPPPTTTVPETGSVLVPLIGWAWAVLFSRALRVAARSKSTS